MRLFARRLEQDSRQPKRRYLSAGCDVLVRVGHDFMAESSREKGPANPGPGLRWRHFWHFAALPISQTDSRTALPRSRALHRALLRALRIFAPRTAPRAIRCAVWRIERRRKGLGRIPIHARERFLAAPRISVLATGDQRRLRRDWHARFSLHSAARELGAAFCVTAEEIPLHHSQ